MNQDEVKNSYFFVLVSPMVNLGEKEKVHLQHFVLTGRPIIPGWPDLKKGLMKEV